MKIYHMKLELDYYGSIGVCPNQIEGTIDGLKFYFRARHGKYTLQVSPNHRDAVFGPVIASGTDAAAGWYDTSEAHEILVDVIEQLELKYPNGLDQNIINKIIEEDATL